MHRDIPAAAVLVAGVLLLFWASIPGPEMSVSASGSEKRAPVVIIPPSHAAVVPTDHRQTIYRVQRVIDGDTILLTDGRQVRYIGMDTPEVSDPRLSRAAREATEANRRLVEDHRLRLEFDIREIDKYGRLLAYVWAGDVFVNEKLLEEGWARLLTIPPDVKYVDRFRAAAEVGRKRRQEIWALGAQVAGASTTTTKTGNCPPDSLIKGNITAAGEKIYHTTSGDFYSKTFPEACFADEASAERAGYRRSRR